MSSGSSSGPGAEPSEREEEIFSFITNGRLHQDTVGEMEVRATETLVWLVQYSRSYRANHPPEAPSTNVTTSHRQYADTFVKRLSDRYKMKPHITRSFLEKVDARRSRNISRTDMFVAIGQILAFDNQMSDLAATFVPEAYTPEPFAEGKQGGIKEMMDVIAEAHWQNQELYRAFLVVLARANRIGTRVESLLLQVSLVFADQPHFVQWFNAFMANVPSERVCIAAGLRDVTDGLTEGQVKSLTEYRFRHAIRSLWGEGSTQYQSLRRLEKGILDGSLSQPQAMLNAKTLFMNRPVLFVAFRHHYLPKLFHRRNASMASASASGSAAGPSRSGGGGPSSKAPRR